MRALPTLIRLSFAAVLATLLTLAVAGADARAAVTPRAAPVVGRPLTPVSYAGVARRSVRRGAYYNAGVAAGAAATTTLPAGCSPGVSCGGTVYAPAYDGGTVVYVQQ